MTHVRRSALCLALLLPACASNEAEDLLTQIQDDDYRETYRRAPGWPDPLLPADGGPHGSFIDIYVNDTMAEAIDSGDSLDAWPEGSLIVKDGFSDEGGEMLRFVTLMEKRGGGNWFWAEYDANLEVDFAGVNESVCTNCHADGEDQVLAFGLP